MLRTLALLAAGLAGFVSILSATTLQGGFDVPWEATRDQAREALAHNRGARFMSRLSNESVLLFTGGTWEDWEMQNLQLSFEDNRFKRGTAFLTANDSNDADFERIASVLAAEYGDPESKGVGQAVWTFKQGDQPTARIELSIGPAGLRLMFGSMPSAGAAAPGR